MVNGESYIAFGKYFYLGTQLKDIPDSYFRWLIKQKWFLESKFEYEMELKNYINNKLKK